MMTRINLQMPDEEYMALVRDASHNLRPVSDHARFLIRSSLGMSPPGDRSQKYSDAALVYEAGSGAAVTAFQA